MILVMRWRYEGRLLFALVGQWLDSAASPPRPIRRPSYWAMACSPSTSA